MQYIDAIGQELQLGDYVIYGKTGYQRPAKIIELPTNISGCWWMYKVLTYATGKIIQRKTKIWYSPTTTVIKMWSCYRLDYLPKEIEEAIENKFLKSK